MKLFQPVEASCKVIEQKKNLPPKKKFRSEMDTPRNNFGLAIRSNTILRNL